MEEEVGWLSRGKKRKAIPNPNKKFMTLADDLLDGETISEPNQAIEEARAVGDVIEVEGMEEEESSNSEAEDLLAVRTHTGHPIINKDEAHDGDEGEYKDEDKDKIQDDERYDEIED
uniref:Uncharacterized protein n=1 Tax=Fusarium oxysporum (strain Fo5176) TaxID=660025 RepID=A0A0D2YEW9_FUSOF